ncbi:MAG TPA: hypothetical protein VHD90_03980 [Phototrophicaceae bacterium]|nr:hypothetical protein [Phototrophicaceae bacterium]
MKTQHLFYLSICVMVILIGALTTQTAQADSYFWRWTTPLPAATCSYDGVIWVDALNVPYEYNLPAGATLDVYTTLNGVTNFVQSVVAPSGSGSDVIPEIHDGLDTSYPLTYSLRYDTVIDSEVVYSSTLTFTCGDDGVAILSLPPSSGSVGSCLDVPVGSVVGRFTSDAVLEWAPGKDTQPNAVVPSGEAAWVVGVDATGAYYKIIWACTYRWVPVGTMGPNYDDVWRGEPLPTNVVS